jgi:hypothetical protein
MTAKPRRHKWSAKVEFPLAHKSERECLNGCGIVKVTRHEHNSHWVEFWRITRRTKAMDFSERIEGDRTPVCEPVRVDA